jgi:hypothetical protein
VLSQHQVRGQMAGLPSGAQRFLVGPGGLQDLGEDFT